MLISWDPPPTLAQNGIIREYSVIVHSAKSGVDLTFFTLHTRLNISGLSPYTIYSVKVAAITVASGPFTNTFNVTTLQDGMFTQCIYQAHTSSAYVGMASRIFHLKLINFLKILCSISFYNNIFIKISLQVKTKFLSITDTVQFVYLSASTFAAL